MRFDRPTFLRGLAASLAAPAIARAAPLAPREPFNVLVLGDSIAWGQGLTAPHRWRTLLERRLGERLRRPIVEIASELHSGATIGLGDRNQIAERGTDATDRVAVDRYGPRYEDASPTRPGDVRSRTFELSYLEEGDYAGEIPSSTPTVFRQIDDFDGGPDRATRIDLVVVSAGINDVMISRLLDPVADRRYVREAIEVHCHHHLLALLDRIRVRFVEPNPKCIVIVLSYYPMIGDESLAIPPVRDLVRALLGSPIQTKAQRANQGLERGAATLTAEGSDVTGAGSRYVSVRQRAAGTPPAQRKQSFLARSLVAAANRFYDLSEAAIDAAVTDANRAPFSASFVHVTPNIDPLHTVFTVQPDPQLWSLEPGGVTPEDELAKQRTALCDGLGIERHDLDPSAINACYVASIGHPNPNGADEYVASIWAALEPRLPK